MVIGGRGRPVARKRALLDSGAVSALARGDALAVALLERLANDRVEVSIPAVVLAECLRGQQRHDAAANRVIVNRPVNPADERIARTAAMLRGALRASAAGTRLAAPLTIDALVVADAVEGGCPCAIVTSDPDDIAQLASRHHQVRVARI